MIMIKTHIELEMAHRLYGVETYSEECRDNVHGHSYKVDIVVQRREGEGELDGNGMVIDFKKLKETVREFEKEWDHSCVLHEGDPLCEVMLRECKKVHVVEENPTAEWMCMKFKDELNEKLEELEEEVEVVEVDVGETSGNIAVWKKD